jgi:hypothetical protein
MIHTEARGGTPYGASTISGPKGELAPSSEDLFICRVQGRAIKRRVRASQHFRSFWGAWRTIAGYEAIHMIRKGQACGSALGGNAVLLHRFILGLFSAVAV